MNRNWSTIEIAGKPVDIFEPVPGGELRFCLLFLHDLSKETPRSNPVLTQQLAELKLACVCPRGGPCWWADRVCSNFDAKQPPERYVLEQVRPWIGHVWGLRDGEIALAGIGMGGQGVLRIAFKHPEQFSVLAALDAAIDHHELYGEGTELDAIYTSREQCRQDTATLHVDPAKQPRHIWFAADPASRWFRGNDRLHEKLTALGVPHTFHVGSPSVAEMLRFVMEALERESRRLL
jgi:pimeloyl-ACP methyl ester carboxylesterase